MKSARARRVRPALTRFVLGFPGRKRGRSPAGLEPLCLPIPSCPAQSGANPVPIFPLEMIARRAGDKRANVTEHQGGLHMDAEGNITSRHIPVRMVMTEH